MQMIIHAAGHQFSLAVCGDDWNNWSALIAQRTTGVQPHPAPQSNKADSGQVRLLKPAIIHTHTHITWLLMN